MVTTVDPPAVKQSINPIIRLIQPKVLWSASAHLHLVIFKCPLPLVQSHHYWLKSHYSHMLPNAVFLWLQSSIVWSPGFSVSHLCPTWLKYKPNFSVKCSCSLKQHICSSEFQNGSILYLAPFYLCGFSSGSVLLYHQFTTYSLKHKKKKEWMNSQHWICFRLLLRLRSIIKTSPKQ